MKIKTVVPMMVCPRCWGHKQPFCDKCQNQGKISNVWLSKNFSLLELVSSNTAQKLRIANDPTVREIDRLLDLSRNLLQPIRDLAGPLKITSGFRSQELNNVIQGSSKSSAHMSADAADLQPTSVTCEQIMFLLSKGEIEFDQAILEKVRGQTWVHVGIKHPTSRIQRNQLLVNQDGKWSTWKPS